MKQLIDFIPLIAFFVTYELYDIYTATKVLMIGVPLQYLLTWFMVKKLEKFQIITLVAVLAFGGLTLLLHDETYLKWKAPIVNLIFALSFLASQFIGEENLVKRMMGHAISLPNDVWRNLNFSWVLFFIISGSANLYVAFTFHEIWVEFKVFGSLGMTLVFMVIQAIYLSRYIEEEEEDKIPAPEKLSGDNSET